MDEIFLRLVSSFGCERRSVDSLPTRTRLSHQWHGQVFLSPPVAIDPSQPIHVILLRFWKVDVSFSPTPEPLDRVSSGHGPVPLPPFPQALLSETSAEQLPYFSLHTRVRAFHVLKRFSRNISAHLTLDVSGRKKNVIYSLPHRDLFVEKASQW